MQHVLDNNAFAPVGRTFGRQESQGVALGYVRTRLSALFNFTTPQQLDICPLLGLVTPCFVSTKKNCPNLEIGLGNICQGAWQVLPTASASVRTGGLRPSTPPLAEC